MDLAFDKFTNKDHSEIISEGTLTTGKTLDDNFDAQGMAGLLENLSANIDITGDANLNVENIDNRDIHLQTEVQEISRQYKLKYKLPPVTDWMEGGIIDPIDARRSGGGGRVDYYPVNGSKITAWDMLKREYTEVHKETKVIKKDPSKILVGGNLKYKGSKLHNKDSSVLIGGDLYLNKTKYKNDNEITSNNTILENEATKGFHYLEVENGKEYNSYEHKHKQGSGRNRYQRRFNDRPSPYSPPAEITNIDLYTNQVKTNIAANINLNSGIDDNKHISDNNNINQALINNNINLIEAKTQANYQIPSSSLYKEAPNGSSYLIETDPRFANYRNWLSSDYMYEQLRFNHNNMHKRLGDGYYEQKLINQQIAELTGRRYLPGYKNNEIQYKALMDNAIKYANDFNLTPGIALTEEQINKLTDNIVWLEETTVQLKDGSTVKALKPQVYLAKKYTDINQTGAIVSANNIITENNIINNGNINTQKLIVNELNNTGVVSGFDILNIEAVKDIINQGGKIVSENGTYIAAQNIINQTTTNLGEVNNGGGNEFSSTYINKVGSISSNKGDILLKAKNNFINYAGQVSAGDKIFIDAGNKVELTTIDIAKKENVVWDADNYDKVNLNQEVGGDINGVNDVVIKGKQGIEIKASGINSEKGATYLTSDKDINITTGIYQEDISTANKYKQKGFLSSKTVSIKHEHKLTDKINSEITGKKVIIDAGNDINIKGSNVASDEGTILQAKNDINIKNDINKRYQVDETYEKKSGLHSFNPFNGELFIGTTKQNSKLEQDNTIASEARSTVDSVNGKVVIQAGNKYHQTSSDVAGKTGVDIFAKKHVIDVDKDILKSKKTDTFEKKGLTVSVSSIFKDPLEIAYNMHKSGKDFGKSKNNRVTAMQAANMGMQAYQAAKAANNAVDVIQGKDTNGKEQNLVKIRATLGSEKSTTVTDNYAEHAVGSNIKSSDGQVRLIASGAGENSTISVIGSDIAGKKGTLLVAEGDVSIDAAKEDAWERTKTKSSSANFGGWVGVGKESYGVGVTGGGSLGKGKGDGDYTHYIASHIGDKDSQTEVYSGGKLSLIGSQLIGKGVKYKAKDLDVISLQDKEEYHSEDKGIHGQVDVAIYGAGSSVEGGVNYSKIDASHRSVNTQAGIFAGDDGHQGEITNHTHLDGGLITSTDKAELEGKNSFTTGTLTHKNIDNYSKYKAEGIDLSGGYGKNGDIVNAKPGEKTASSISFTPGFGYDKDNQTSTTKSGINTANITITDAKKQQQLTGKTVEQTIADIKTDITTDNAFENSGKLDNVFDKEKVQQEIDRQVRVTKQFGTTVSQFKQEWNNDLDKKIEDIEKNPNLKEEEKKKAIEKQEIIRDNRNLIIDAMAGVLSGPNAGGIVGDIAKAVAPFASHQIGQYFKNQKDPITKETKEGSAEHIASHVALGVIVAALTKNNIVTGGLAGGVSEAIVPIAVKLVYGKNTKPEDLTREQKENIINITKLATASASFASGQSATDIASNTQIASNAVSNNYLTAEQWKTFIEKFKEHEGDDLLKDAVVYEALQQDQYNEDMIALQCGAMGNEALCNAARQEAQKGLEFIKNTIEYQISNDIENQYDDNNIFSYKPTYLERLDTMHVAQNALENNKSSSNTYITEGYKAKIKIQEMLNQGVDKNNLEVKKLTKVIKKELDSNLYVNHLLNHPNEPYKPNIFYMMAEEETKPQNIAMWFIPFGKVKTLVTAKKIAQFSELINNIRKTGEITKTAEELVKAVEVSNNFSRLEKIAIVKQIDENIVRYWTKNKTFVSDYTKRIAQGADGEAYVLKEICKGCIDTNIYKKNFNAIDAFDEITGRAISTKTLDPMSKSYQKSGQLKSTLKDYIDNIKNFKGDEASKAYVKKTRENFEILPKDINSKELQLFISNKVTAKQIKEIEASAEYAKKHGIKFQVNITN